MGCVQQVVGVWGLYSRLWVCGVCTAGCGCVGSVQQVVGVWGLYSRLWVCGVCTAGCGCVGSEQQVVLGFRIYFLSRRLMSSWMAIMTRGHTKTRTGVRTGTLLRVKP